MPRKSRKKKKEEPIAVPEEVYTNILADAENNISEDTPIVEEPAVEEITAKAKLLALIATAPELPNVSDKEFHRNFCANFEPQYNQFLAKLGELAACLT